ncbi:MAG: class I SAM-dependent methyltransferase [Bacteroidota bacterium]
MSEYREQQDKNLFNTISSKYAEKDIYPISKVARAFQIECMIEFLSKEYNFSRASRLIEVGCGHGANSEYLSKIYKSFLGVDYSDELIKIANKRYRTENSHFVVDNIKEIEKHGKFDVVVGIGILHHVDNLSEVLEKLKEIGHEKTLYLFYEPQGGNPLIQTLRKLRIKMDSSYSGDQMFFEKKELINKVSNLGFKNIKTRYNGYLTPPFAQVMLKPDFLFRPAVKFSIMLDRILFRKINSRLAWNFMIAFTR